MKRVLWLLLLLPALVLAPPALSQTEEVLLEFEGYDYESPDVDPTQFGGIDDYYNMFGFIQAVNPTYLTVDFSTNEYTIEFWQLCSAGYFDFGNLRFITYTTGYLGVYEDPFAGGTAAVFGVNPPNATAPATFLDGTAILLADIVNFGITLNLDDGTGNFVGDVDFTGGTQAGNIPAGSTVYTFAGLTSGPLANVPEGYVHQVTGQIKIEVPVQNQSTSWGRMKALYR